ncbi:hypothetical protein HCN44_008044 [Aphidius gifuensis]|uniref:Uncharacterized protein n=1 Tax=Aphidius gifuensis TaxID=684658 RepID=A0A834XLW7_APHGI|nr:GATA zinc finger domain-containing protein 8-like [Aphidius gifuensis]KAF7989370.1 hypothetical protein HCN44_008044 [Aphidius gifuensis]
MAPTVCMSDMPTTRADAPSRRLRNKNGITRHSRMEFKYIDNIKTEVHDNNNTENITENSNNWSNNCDYNVERFLSKYHLSSNQQNEQWKIIMKRRRGLLEIAARTIALIHRNNIFQKKVDALRYETQDYYLQSSIYDNNKKNNISNEINCKFPNNQSTNICDKNDSNLITSIENNYNNKSENCIYPDSESDHDTSDESDR